MDSLIFHKQLVKIYMHNYFFKILVFVGCFFVYGCGEVSPYVQVPKIGKELPPFENVLGSDGEIYAFSDFKGAPLLLMFQTVHCVYCEEERPYLEELRSEFPAVRFFTIDVADSIEEVREHIVEKNIGYIWGIDQTEFIAEKYLSATTPDHFFVDVNGILQDRASGFLSKEQLESKLQNLVLSPSDE